jgi:hypothetical protein
VQTNKKIPPNWDFLRILSSFHSIRKIEITFSVLTDAEKLSSLASLRASLGLCSNAGLFRYPGQALTGTIALR